MIYSSYLDIIVYGMIIIISMLAGAWIFKKGFQLGRSIEIKENKNVE